MDGVAVLVAVTDIDVVLVPLLLPVADGDSLKDGVADVDAVADGAGVSDTLAEKLRVGDGVAPTDSGHRR